MKDEHKLDLALHKMRGRSHADFDWGTINISVDHINYSAGGRGSPDSLLIIDLEIPVFGEIFKARIPFLLEAEKSGIDAAMVDLEKFTSRSLKGEPSFLCLPMLALPTEGSKKTRSELKDIKARFDIKEISLPMV